MNYFIDKKEFLDELEFSITCEDIYFNDIYNEYHTLSYEGDMSDEISQEIKEVLKKILERNYNDISDDIVEKFFNQYIEIDTNCLPTYDDYCENTITILGREDLLEVEY